MRIIRADDRRIAWGERSESFRHGTVKLPRTKSEMNVQSILAGITRHGEERRTKEGQGENNHRRGIRLEGGRTYMKIAQGEKIKSSWQATRFGRIVGRSSPTIIAPVPALDVVSTYLCPITSLRSDACDQQTPTLSSLKDLNVGSQPALPLLTKRAPQLSTYEYLSKYLVIRQASLPTTGHKGFGPPSLSTSKSTYTRSSG